MEANYLTESLLKFDWYIDETDKTWELTNYQSI